METEFERMDAMLYKSVRSGHISFVYCFGVGVILGN